MLRTDSTQSELDLGYEFLPPATPEYPYHSQLIVRLRACPTEDHYDPEVVQCPVAVAGQGCETLSVRHPWSEADHHRVYCGLIVLNDRKDKRVEAFTFGGDLSIDTNSAQTTCVFQSPAPILGLSGQGTLAVELAVEVQALLAERRAAWGMEQAPEDFDRRLAELDPLQLYLACLVSMREPVRLIAAAGDEAAHSLLHLIDRTQRELKEAGRWPEPAVPLDELI